jgi:protein phosphatase
MVVLVGPSGSGKSTFARRHFAATEVLSSDEMWAMVADDPADQGATDAAFELLHTALALRLARRRLSVVDATNLEAWARGRLLALARRHARPAVAIAFGTPLDECLARNAARPDRRLPEGVIRRQHRALPAALRDLPREGFAAVHVLGNATAPEEVAVTRQGE